MLTLVGFGAAGALRRSPTGLTAEGKDRYPLLQELSLRNASITDETMALLAAALYHDRYARYIT